MSEINDGGPAFAAGAANEHTGWTQEGMSLRDYFAGQALAGHLASINPGGIDAPFAKRVARDVYLVADAMLAARKEGQP